MISPPSAAARKSLALPRLEDLPEAARRRRDVSSSGSAPSCASCEGGARSRETDVWVKNSSPTQGAHRAACEKIVFFQSIGVRQRQLQSIGVRQRQPRPLRPFR